MKEHEFDKISAFNDAVGQIARLNVIWQACNRLSKAGRFIDWNNELDIAYRELHSDIVEFKLKGEHATYKVTDKLITENFNNKAVLYKLLVKKETVLRRIQDLVGKGSKIEEKYDQLM